MNLEEALELMNKAGYKDTKKRRDMIEVFVQQNRYISAKMLQQYLSPLYPQISFDTIYRNLSTFEEVGIIERTELNGERHYKIGCKGQNHHHHHFICNSCGKTTVLEYCPIGIFANQLPNYQITAHKIELYGLCDECRRHQITI